MAPLRLHFPSLQQLGRGGVQGATLTVPFQICLQIIYVPVFIYNPHNNVSLFLSVSGSLSLTRSLSRTDDSERQTQVLTPFCLLMCSTCWVPCRERIIALDPRSRASGRHKRLARLIGRVSSFFNPSSPISTDIRPLFSPHPLL